MAAERASSTTADCSQRLSTVSLGWSLTVASILGRAFRFKSCEIPQKVCELVPLQDAVPNHDKSPLPVPSNEK